MAETFKINAKPHERPTGLALSQAVGTEIYCDNLSALRRERCGQFGLDGRYDENRRYTVVDR